MGLDSIWDEEGEWLTSKSKGFKARSTGCDCCSSELTTPDEVKKEAIDSLRWIWLASTYFKWNLKKMLSEAKKLHKLNKVKEKEARN